MPTSSDGVMEANFDPQRNLVNLVVHGENWFFPESPVEMTILRSTPAQVATPVRGAERVLAPGGTLVWSDNEAPMGVEVRYRAEGFYSSGGSHVSAQAIVPMMGAAWGLWVKVPGRPELTTRVEVNLAPEQSRETLGGYWQITGAVTQAGFQEVSGPTLAQSAGMGALMIPDLEVTTYSPAELSALQRAVRQAPGQVVLLQSGQPEEIPSGYYQVQSMSTTNPAGMRSDLQPLRRTRLSLVEVSTPAGPATGWSGATYGDVADAFATYQDIVDADVSYLDLATGNF
ncbi:hypothetical protein GCM10009718_36950 [Isoptericola halotolerans]|uniref:Uncharacterized protein n=1 Tax=Isoptericola halotolerans TaxID=300560 RepID=A0ABX2A8H6_9MICO|nr:hypothetical protein [Isoptericola halotolerans]NOV98225.1 hypothetical protein [Isoptericola halotolerans]